MGAASLRKNLQPEPYTLPLTLTGRSGLNIIWIICLLIIVPGSLILTVFPHPIAWAFCFLLMACYWLGYLIAIMPGGEVRLTEDRISYYEQSCWKEMEYRRITAVRYYRRNKSLKAGLEQILVLFGDNGDTITMNFGTNPHPEYSGIINDMLRKNAPPQISGIPRESSLPIRAQQTKTDPPFQKPLPSRRGFADTQEKEQG